MKVGSMARAGEIQGCTKGREATLVVTPWTR